MSEGGGGGAFAGGSGALSIGAILGLEQGLGAKLALYRDSKQRGFAAWMAKNRYRYTMNDMRLAGLNPILAAGGGMAGSVPSAALAARGGGSGGAGALGSYINQARLVQSEIAKNNATALAARETAANTTADTNLKYQDHLHRAQLYPIVRAEANSAADLRALEATAEKMLMPARRADKAFFESEFGELVRKIQRTMGGRIPVPSPTKRVRGR